jgi:UDP-glucose 4-epimerase
MRVLVSGGAGFIGSHVVEQLLAQGHELAVLDNLSTGHRQNVPASVRLYEVDLRERAAVAAAVSDFSPEAVTHQAAQASVPISVRDPHLDCEINMIGGLNLLDACTAPGARVGRFVFASTGGAIYGEVAEGTRATEATRPAPTSPYAIHKLAFEGLLGAYARQRGLSPTVLRYANVYGPRQDPHGEAGAVAIFLAAIAAGRTLGINARRRLGDDGCVRDYVYVADCARANVLALEGALPEPVLNVGTGVETTTRALASELMRLAGREVPLESRPPRAGDLERSVLDASLAEKYLGSLEPLTRGLTHTVRHFGL